VIRLVVKTAPLEQWRVALDLRARVKVALGAAGIASPRPPVTPAGGGSGTAG
jgi:moderate conductance mechanosensitive channel